MSDSNENYLANNNAKLPPGGLAGKQGHLSIEKPKNSRLVIFRLWRYLSRQRALLFLVLFLLLINIGATLLGSYLLRPIINNYIVPRNIPGLIRMIILLAGIYTVGAITGIYLNRLMIKIAQKTISTIRTDLFSKLQTLPLKFFDSTNHGELMSRFTNDMDNVSDALNTSILQLFSSAITLTGIFTLMVYISPLLTLVTIVVVPFMLWVASAIIKKSKGFFANQQIALGAVDGYIEEMITGQKVVKVFCFEAVAEVDFEKLNYDLRDKATKAQLYSGVMQPIIQNLNTINFALTATAGGLLAIFSGLDLGGLAAFLQYSRQFGQPVNEISSQYNTLQGALAGAERIFQIMDEIPEVTDTPGAVQLVNIKGDIRFNAVTFGYDKGIAVLKDITINAKAGQKIALVGSTGAGKTTIMNLLPRFYDIWSGLITIDGVDIMKLQRSSLRKSLAIVLQDTHLFTGSVMENIRYGRLEASDDEVIAAATLSGADSFIQRLPKGYKTLLQNDGGNLSQGQRQLLNIARATVSRPSILILDEATSSIDTRTEQFIQKGMDQLMNGRTSFIVAHRLSTVRNADEILVLENGEIIERGNHEKLLEKKGRYYQLYKGQFG
ncbi:ATP-binding cassette subfamily B protein [Mucilaginibacter gracilis]|uniref:ATP-binding cassette subfamily B protein n=1 Tax=Mucilaginibacter gracilis TaxID=423350 RepID=A0A495J6S6_9SPHI|nr:ABC transporter ATP-binding protein [Mucilaginibacter gracilis]RKR84690.1 ATP-binding cassette subfamily B protein [Mucilaginibacter gracilis]